MAAAAISKNRKGAISPARFDRFRPNLVQLHISTLLSRQTVKSLKFKKSKMAPAAILKKNEKNRHISTAVLPISTKFGKATHFDGLELSDYLKFEPSLHCVRWGKSLGTEVGLSAGTLCCKGTELRPHTEHSSPPPNSRFVYIVENWLDGSRCQLEPR